MAVSANKVAQQETHQGVIMKDCDLLVNLNFALHFGVDLTHYNGSQAFFFFFLKKHQKNCDIGVLPGVTKC